jgi:hypothetical protein
MVWPLTEVGSSKSVFLFNGTLISRSPSNSGPSNFYALPPHPDLTCLKTEMAEAKAVDANQVPCRRLA